MPDTATKDVGLQLHPCSICLDKGSRWQTAHLRKRIGGDEKGLVSPDSRSGSLKWPGAWRARPRCWQGQGLLLTLRRGRSPPTLVKREKHDGWSSSEVTRQILELYTSLSAERVWSVLGRGEVLIHEKSLLKNEVNLHNGIIVGVQSLSCVWLFVTPWTVACQAPLSMGFSRQEY